MPSCISNDYGNVKNILREVKMPTETQRVNCAEQIGLGLGTSETPLLCFLFWVLYII